MAVGNAKVRLFFAGWPSPELQAGLHEVALRARGECGGRVVSRDNIHLTLAFLGDVDRGRIDEIAAVAAGLRCAGSDLVVDHLRYWRHNRIVWAAARQCPDALVSLAERLGSGLRGIGFRLENRPYVPHVTLLRNAHRAPVSPAFAPLAWPVREFVLVESRRSEHGRTYDAFMSWQLEG